MDVPQYEEISVKNLYQDAINDDTLRDYLPEMEMNSNRLPERKFFFGILGTLKNDYLRKIIQDANMIRYNVEENNEQDDFIAIDNQWYEELIKHPFLSSNDKSLTIFVEKPGKAIFLIKKRTKLIRSKKNTHKFDLSHRLSQQNIDENYEEEQKYDFGKANKRQKTFSGENQSLFSQEESSRGMQFNI